MSRARLSVAPAPLPARPLITADALATMLATTRGAIYARHARGGIPGGIRLGRSLRFDPDVIAAWLAQSAVSGGCRDDPPPALEGLEDPPTTENFLFPLHPGWIREDALLPPGRWRKSSSTALFPLSPGWIRADALTVWECQGHHGQPHSDAHFTVASVPLLRVNAFHSGYFKSHVL